jgi:hypothetical protein
MLMRELSEELGRLAKWRHEEAEATAKEVRAAGGQIPAIQHGVPYGQCKADSCERVRDLLARVVRV